MIVLHRSRFCESCGCVEVARINNDSVAVRDSEDPEGRVLVVSAEEWTAFTDGVRTGEFG